MLQVIYINYSITTSKLNPSTTTSKLAVANSMTSYTYRAVYMC